MSDKGDRRYQAAAARWHALLVIEEKLPLGKSEMLLQDARRHQRRQQFILRRRLLERVDREGLTRTEMSRTAGVRPTNFAAG
jgi:hypothetical protein